ncbi:MAG: response regulator transcription factor [Blastococcus sp.]
MSERPLRVAIADDHYLVREGVRQLLELGGEVEVVAAVGTAIELHATLAERAADVVVTDIRMPPGHHVEGIEAAHAVRARYPGVGVVVLSAHADAAYAIELFRDGTAGLAYLLKDRVGDRVELLRAIRATAAGGSVIDPLVVETMLRRHGRGDDSPHGRLTQRERDVLEQMAAGRSNAAIGRTLYLSLSAVEKNITAIFTKLGVSDEGTSHRRVAAVLTFLAEG